MHRRASASSTGTSGVIGAANGAACDFLHYPADRLRGKPLAVFTRGMSRRGLRNALHQVISSPDPLNIALNVTLRDGRVRRVELTAAAARDLHGSVVEIRWLIVDRTAQSRRDMHRRARAIRLEALVASAPRRFSPSRRSRITCCRR